MANKIILCADSTCDLGDELGARYNVHFFPYNVILDDKTYTDGVDIQPEDIYRTYREKGLLPKTAAVNISNYIDFSKSGPIRDMILSMLISPHHCHPHTRIAWLLPGSSGMSINRFPKSLSGSALLVIEAAERIAKGMPREHIAESSTSSEITSTKFYPRHFGIFACRWTLFRTGFDGINLLRLKVSIEVDNSTGKMGVGKIYRGNLQKQRLQYTKDQLGRYPNIKKDRVFITHSGVSEESIAPVYDYIKGLNLFDEIFVTQASCTISAHCGPETLGVLFMTEE